MKVCIAEKPSVAKEIATILGAKIKKDGYFEGNGYRVTWTFGHLCTLKEPDEYTPEWKKWNINALPMVPPKYEIKLIKNKGVSKQFQTIKKLVNDCSEVINCGDAGIEGELIQRWVLKKAACKKPVKRLWISSLTEEAIREGFTKLKDSADYDLLYAAGNARAIGDWLLGMNASRLYTLKYADGRGVLSIGRVQTPTLALIVQREKEIQNFKPETYWELKTRYRDVIFSAVELRFTKKDKAEEILNRIKDNDFKITSFTRKKGTEHPPPLFDLTSLQVECNKKYGFTADNTLKTVQKLYEKKFVSYPRVDTRYLPDDVYPKIPGILKGLKSWSELTEVLLKDKIRKTKKVFDNSKVTDHHAIIPTGQDARNLTPQEEKVYDVITRRFIAVFYPDCIVMNTTVLGEVQDVKFKATGKQILEEGWRVLYPRHEKQEKKEDKDDKDAKDEEGSSQIIPEFEKGETGPHKPYLKEKETKPPKPYTEATLLRAMETAGKKVDDGELRELMKENGIGRPSTRAGIIETLFRRSYITRTRKNIIPTPTGIQLIDAITNELLKSVELTGMWERKLRDIERGEYKAAVFLNEMTDMVKNLVSEVKKETGKKISIEKTKKNYPKKSVKKTSLKKSSGAQAIKSGKAAKRTNETGSETPVCPVCGKGTIIKGKSAYGCSEFRSGCSFRVSFTIQGKTLTEKQIFDLIKKGKTGNLSGFMVEDKKVKGSIFLDEKQRAVFKPEAVKENSEHPKKKNTETISSGKLSCPKCGRGTMIKGRAAWGCSCYREGCRFVIPFDKLKEDYGTEELTTEILDKIVR